MKTTQRDIDAAYVWQKLDQAQLIICLLLEEVSDHI